jgi:predicted lipid-binding transport protein (Tim44 family)
MKNKTSRWPARMKKWGGMAAGLMVGAVFGFVSVLLCEWCMGGQAGRWPCWR